MTSSVPAAPAAVERVPQPAAARWRRVAAAMAVLGWGGNQFLPLMPLYRDTVGYTQFDVDLFLASYVLGLVPGFLLSSVLSDRHGRRAIMVAGICVSIVGSASIMAAGETIIGMCIGRMLSGLGVATAMVAGSSWVRQLAEREGLPHMGARRASLALSIGFGGGAGLAGLLAQYVAFPAIVPYAVHILASVAVLPFMLSVPAADRRIRSGFSIRDLGISRDVAWRFWSQVAPGAPWIFGAAALSFAYGPSIVKDELGSSQIVFATAVTLITLGTGTVTQLFSAPLDRMLRNRSGPVGVMLVALGASALAVVTIVGHPVVVIAIAPVFGCGYGLIMVAGLSRTQALARPEELATLTAWFYSLSYTGFFLPLVFAAVVPLVGNVAPLLATAGVALVCAVAIAIGGGRRSPRSQG